MTCAYGLFSALVVLVDIVVVLAFDTSAIDFMKRWLFAETRIAAGVPLQRSSAFGLCNTRAVVDIVVVFAFDTSAIDFMIWLFAETRIAARVPLQRSSAFGLCNTLAVVDIVVAFAFDTYVVDNVVRGRTIQALAVRSAVRNLNKINRTTGKVVRGLITW